MADTYEKIDDSTLAVTSTNTIQIPMEQLIAQKNQGQDMIDQGQVILDDANAKIEMATSLGITIPE